ncbi:hypothetical protein V1512DRAFT_259730 [Lipomyces arxii]|uniref:uncharacterized protein n=1 Tax=Lipomyces arxii TaxID=56418 RepID=UPI0034CEFBAB
MSLNTGPKGVVNDANESILRIREQRENAARERYAGMLSRAAIGTTVLDDEAEAAQEQKLAELGDEGLPTNAAIKKYNVTKIALGEDRSNIGEEDENDDLDSELDELIDLDLDGERAREELSVLQKWRDARLKELQESSYKKSVKQYGWVKDVDSNGYLKELDECETAIIVLIYNETNESRMIAWAFERLAQQYANLSFIKLHGYEAEIDPVCVPTILAYANHGERIIANIVRVIDEIPSDTDVSGASLETVLKRFGAL